MAELLIRDAMIVTVDRADTAIERGTILVEDRRLTAVRPTEPGDATLPATMVIDGTGMVAMPGLVNAHVHTEVSIMRGTCSGLGPMEVMLESSALYRVLTKKLPVESQERWSRASWRLGILQMLKAGITCLNDMGVTGHVGAEVVGEAGLRAVMGHMISDSFMPEPAEEQIARALALVDRYHGAYGGRLKISLCPHGDLYNTRPVLETCARLAQEHPELVVHTHALEMPQADVAARAMGAVDSIGLFEDLGLLDERLVLAHLVAASERDIDRVVKAGAHVVHCPSIFTHFGTGDKRWLPLPHLLKRGGNAALGLDDPGWIDASDLFREARLAAGMASFLWGAPQLTPQQVLRMLTVNGARALGLGEELGSLEVGKQADLILLDFRQPKFRPLNNLPALLVHAATGDNVDTVVVGGQVLMQGGRVLTMDETGVMEEAQGAMTEAAEVTGWQISLAGSRPPRKPLRLRLPPTAKTLSWAARLGWQTMKERIRPGQGDE